ncbi:ribosomal protein S18 [Stachybotrys elegans]|uniref:Small ribosomal subunit protein bS18m n=1 Tax=Stachybotrys elegans TaxID=80388 RepID=A0A8K0SXK5_9HYPO|nr:ribosomal protein S18 [Stachybotrys elegans]
MHLRPQAPGALSATLRTLVSRQFSSTAAAQLPPREPRQPHAPRQQQQQSSTDSVLGMSEAKWSPRPNGNKNNFNRNTSNHSSGSSSSSVTSSKLLEKFRNRTEEYNQRRLDQLEASRNQKISRDYLKQMPRSWEVGDVYSPHDLSPVEMRKWRKKSLRKADVIDALGVRPEDLYKNFSLIQDFTTPGGAIQHSKFTNLSPVNQRKVAKMIRRAQGMGLYPSVHDHPELIRSQFYPARKQ